MPDEIMSDPDLVVQIENNYYPWAQAAPMIMSYLAFKQPLPPGKIGASLNDQFLGDIAGEKEMMASYIKRN